MFRKVEDGPTFRATLAIAASIAAISYLVARTTMLKSDQPFYSGLFLTVEGLAILQALLFLWISHHAPVRTPNAPPPGLSVDIFIPTLNEPLAVVRRTVVAALAIRYPHTTWLLDDGARAGMQELAAELGCHYLARSQRQGAKAGNLNNGLAHASGDFVAVFDADHAAQPDFLDKLLGYFDDPSLALVQTPQDYFNTDAFQYARTRDPKLIWHDQSPFHYVDQPSRDGWGAATLCGCSAVLRRAHLDSIGGFATETVTEDMHTAVRLQKKGLRTLYHAEPLAFGIAPPDYRGYLRQRLRWGEGNMQVCRLEGLPFSRELTWRQNIAYFMLAFPYLNAWLRVVIYTAPILALSFNIVPMEVTLGRFVLFFAPYMLLTWLAYEQTCRGYGQLLLCEQHALARTLIGLSATFGFFRRNIPFRVSSKSLAARTNVVSLLPFVGLLAAGLGSVIYATFARLNSGGPLPAITDGVLVIFILLALFHALAAARLIQQMLRPTRHEHDTYPFPVAVPIEFNDGRVLFTKTISADGATFEAALQDQSIDATLFLPGERLPVSGYITRDQIRFHWPKLAMRDRLDQSLHARQWTRVLRGLHENNLTPLEKIGLVRPCAGTRPQPASPWSTALLKAGADDGSQLVFLRSQDDSGRIELISFGELAPLATVFASAEGSFGGAELNIVESAKSFLDNPGALDSINARCWIGKLSHVLTEPSNR